MISTYKLHQAYIQLYREFMRYIWDWNTVYTLAELESAVFQAFPDVSAIQTLLYKLRICVRDGQISDTWIDSSIQQFLDLIDNTAVYLKLTVPKEVFSINESF